MDFQEYLISKKIDVKLFKAAEPEMYAEWELQFEEMHPKSFTSQKLYFINDTRRRFTLTEKTPENTDKKAPVSAKPKIPGVKKAVKIPLKKKD